MSKTKISMLFSTTVLSTLIASGVMADGKVFPGHLCVPLNNGAGAFYNLFGIGNGGTGWLEVVCPGINDTLNDTEQNWIMAMDQNNDPDGNIRCRMCSIYHHAGSGANYGWLGDYGYTSGYGSHWQQIDLEAIGANNRSSKYIYCRIPGRDIGLSYLGEYYIEE